MQPKHPVQRLFAYFTGPMPIMIWIALIVEILDKQWPDVVVLLILQFVNGKCVCFCVRALHTCRLCSRSTL